MCSSAQFECGEGGGCIPEAWTCDGENDCADHSDERNCKPENMVPCGPEELRCRSGQCVPVEWQCDGEMDCQEGLDEWDVLCNKSGENQCKAGEFRCHSDGSCIPGDWRCDGVVDCARDAADEEECDVSCTEEEFKCKTDGVCIQDRWVCDGAADCKDGSDEANCSVPIQSQCEGANMWRCEGSGVCVDLRWRCDGERDCDDGSDETSCDYQSDSGSGERITCAEENSVRCGTGAQCVLRDWVCDGDRDCDDGSDEENCEEIKQIDLEQAKSMSRKASKLTELEDNDTAEKKEAVKLISLEEAKNISREALSMKDDPNEVEEIKCDLETMFDCGPGYGCVPHERVCDHHNDCGAWQDEPESCDHSGEACDGGDRGGCDQLCLASPSGHRCSCHPGYRLVTNTTCADINECEATPNLCSHSCHNREGSYECTCHPGYSVNPQNSSLCQVRDGDVRLVYGHGSDLSIVATSGVREERPPVLRLPSYPADVDLMVSARLVFWIDTAKGAIYRSKMEEGGARKMVIPQGVGTGDSIAVDWVNSNLYWASRDQNRIIVTSLDGAKQKTVVNNTKSPSSIRVIPERSLLIWSEKYDVSRLVQSSMDGSDAKVLLENQEFMKSPIDIAVDYEETRIYWIDNELNHIASVSLTGSDPRIVKSELPLVKGIAVFEDWLYWTDSRAIYRSHKLGGDTDELVTEAAHLHHLVPYHPMAQPRARDHVCSGGQCSHLCVPVPGDQGLRASCLCPDHSSLTSDGAPCSPLGHHQADAQVAGGKHNKTEIIDRHVEELRKGKEKDNLIIILLLGSIAGCALVFLSIILVVIKCRKNSQRDSLDSLDSFEKPPLLNRNLYQPPRRSTFSKTCIPESDSMVPLNREGEGSLSSCQDSTEATPMNVSENDEEIEIESV